VSKKIAFKTNDMCVLVLQEDSKVLFELKGAVCVCVCERERERERETTAPAGQPFSHSYSSSTSFPPLLPSARGDNGFLLFLAPGLLLISAG